jgi:hypothetical protein
MQCSLEKQPSIRDYPPLLEASFAAMSTTVVAGAAAESRGPVVQAMRERAKEVRKMNEMIGNFEWVVFGVIKRVRVLLLFGRTVVDVKEWFAPGLPQHFRTVLRVSVAQGNSHIASVSEARVDK